MMLHDKPVEDVPGTPPELMALLRVSLSPGPAARPPSAVALRDALADPRSPGPVTASDYACPVRPPGAPPRDRLLSMPTLGPQVSAPTWGRRPEAGTAGRRLAPRYAGMAVGLIVILAAALLIGVRFFAHGASPGARRGGPSSGAATGGGVDAVGVFGIATMSAGCPAAALRVATARCPANSECFNGLTVISGAASAEPLPCNAAHVWETFAIAILPADVQTFDQPTVAADPTVRRVCSEAVLLASRQGPARRLPAPAWDIQVLPPSEAAYDSGSRVYRCLANEIGHEPGTSQFRR